MAKNMKIRRGNDGFSYPYTSPDLVIDENGKSATTKFNELEAKIGTGSGTSIDDVNTSTDKTWSSSKIDSQFKDIANLSLTKHTDGKVYIKKQNGTLIGDGIEISGSNVDLSKITMSMSGQTLNLLNDGKQVATVEIPTAVVTDEQLTKIIQSKIDDGTLTSLTLGDNSVSTSNVQDRAITPNKTNFFSENRINLWNYATDYIDSDQGINDDGTDNSDYIHRRTKYFKVGENETIYIKFKQGAEPLYVFSYDANKTFLSKQQILLTNQLGQYITPPNCQYIRLMSNTYGGADFSTLIVSKNILTVDSTPDDVEFKIKNEYKNKKLIKSHMHHKCI